jgi:2-dehydro-3-deoxyglucarate aldolase
MSNGNVVRERLREGTPVFGARAQTFAPAIVEVYGRLGFDFVWLDFEHGGPSPYDASALDHLARAAEGADVELLARLPSGDPPLVHRVLDAGLRTLLIPRVETAAEVRRAVRAAHFAYDDGAGDRGYGGGRPAGWGADADGYVEREDSAVLVGAMIEHERAVENVEAILDVPELGFAFVGANDLSVSMGHAGEPDHPAVAEAIGRVEKAAAEAGVPLGAPRHDDAAAEAAVDDGYRVLRVGDEIGAVRATLGDRLERLRGAAGRD